MQQPEQQSAGYSKLNVWAASLTSATTALIMAILSIPLHLAHARAVFDDRGPINGPGPGVMPHPMLYGGGFAIGWVLIALLVVLVYAGVAGAIFAAIYNALLSRR